MFLCVEKSLNKDKKEYWKVSIKGDDFEKVINFEENVVLNILDVAPSYARKMKVGETVKYNLIKDNSQDLKR